MSLQNDYVTADTVDHPECYAKITAMDIDRNTNKIQYDVTLYHNRAAKDLSAPMFTIFIAGNLDDYTTISEIDVVKRSYLHLKSISEFGAWSDV